MPDQDTTDRAHRGSTSVKPYQIRGRFLTAVALRLEGPADGAMLADLDVQLRQTPQFFADAPLVIDVDRAAGQVDAEDLRALVEHLRYRRISVFALQGGTRDHKVAAATLGLIWIPAGRDAGPRASETAPAPAPEAGSEPSRGAGRIITTPVRSGQSVVADTGDLVVVAPVSSGAELIAAGNIHVYGQLRGRAAAGAFGDETARIFCQSLDAELLSIAGLYLTSEAIGADIRGKSVQAFLQGDRLRVVALEQNQNKNRSRP